MIAALCRAMAAQGQTAETFDANPVSNRKKSALFDMVERFILVALKAGAEGPQAWNKAIPDESRKSIKTAFALLGSQVHPDMVRSGFASAGLVGLTDPGDRLEADIFAAGACAGLKGYHPYSIMRMMTARLGQEYYDTTSAWILERTKRRRVPDEELIIPGDLPEIIAALEQRPVLLELAVRSAGPAMSAAALCGCPMESIKAAQAPFGRIGGAVLKDSIKAYRSKLSTEEIVDAQTAFAELLHELDKTIMPTSTEAWGNAPVQTTPDPGLSADLTELILDMDAKILRQVALAMDVKKLAVLLQIMTPMGHDKLLATIGSMRENRVLKALDTASPLGAFELTREAQAFAQRILAAVSPKGRSRSKPIPLPAQQRRLLSAILSRE